VFDCLGSCLSNKYSEGLPGHRYYGGNEVIDQIEDLCISRALAAFSLDEKAWGVNVQPYSGSPANLSAYLALLKPGEKIMGLDLPSGGHLTHGYQTENKKISHSSLIFESKPYKVDQTTGLIDYEQLKKDVKEFSPKLLIAGYSCYPRDLDYAKFKEAADLVGAYFLVDMAHYSGLVASKLLKSPFEYADVVTTTTHKSLRGPRAAMIFFKNEHKEKINFSVFPGMQGGPHENQIAGIATQLKEVMSEEFKEYSRNVIKNAKKMAEELIKRGHTLATGGTDNHLILYDCRPMGLTGSKVERACELVQITINKNSIVGDKSAITPGGVRIGTPAVTTRGMGENDMVTIVEFFDRVIKICQRVQTKVGKKLQDFNPALETDEEIIALRKEVIAFSSKFYLQGVKKKKYSTK